MKKITFLLIFIFLAISFSSPAHAESIYTKKIVSVVYDDSGSMSYGDQTSWGYANYAMQYFCGALNPEDQLYITYMSDYTNQIIPDGFSTDRQHAIDSIRDHVASSGTPFDAIEYAYSALRNAQSYDSNTQFWLVIISDGNFANGFFDVSADQLNSKLSDISQRTAPNGSRPMIQFLAIGDDIIEPTARPDNNIFVEHARNSDEITDVLSGIADKISGRYKTPVKSVDGHTIEFSSDVPLLNIAIALQKENADIIRITANDQPLNIASVYSLKEPQGGPGWNTEGISDLRGTLALANKGAENIPAGTYRIEFSKDIPADSVDILLEPALELRVSFTKGDEVISDSDALYEGDSIDISCDVYEMGTDIKIDPALLPGDAAFSVTVNEDGVQAASSASHEISGYVLTPGLTQISATLQLENIAPVHAHAEFTPHAMPIYGLEAVTPSDITIARTDLNENTQGLHFVMTIDGIPADKQQSAGHEFTALPPGHGIKLQISQLDDGSYVITPSRTSLFLLFAPLGEYTITGVLDGKYNAEGTLRLSAGSFWPYMRNTLYWLLPLLLLMWLLSVKHFMPCTIKCERVEFDKRGGISEKNFSTHDMNASTDFFGSPIAKTNPRFLSHFLRESMDSFNGLQFKAGGSSTITLPCFFLRRGKIVEVIGSSLTDKIVSFSTLKKMTDDDYEVEYARLQETEPRSSKSIFNEYLSNRTMFVMLSRDDRAMFVYTVKKIK